MEDIVKDQPSAAGNTIKSASKLLRYPLRSATKLKEAKSPVPELVNSASANKRGRITSSVSQSVNVLDLSGKDKSAKPPRRLSIPTKSTSSSIPKPAGNTTPITEARAKKSDTPLSEISRSSNRKKFSVLSSASYWLTHIKHSESAAKHSISIGFFKLALEAGCEPIQRMRDELKSYARQHNLVELGEPVKELFESYNIVESFEQLQVSETCSQVPEDGTKSSDDDARSSSSVTGTRKLKPKSLNTDIAGSGKEIKSNTIVKAVKQPVNKSSSKAKLVSDAAVRGKADKKKLQNPKKQESKQKMMKKQGKEAVHEEGLVNQSPAEEQTEENKENLEDPSQMEEEMNVTEVEA